MERLAQIEHFFPGNFGVEGFPALFLGSFGAFAIAASSVSKDKISIFPALVLAFLIPLSSISYWGIATLQLVTITPFFFVSAGAIALLPNTFPKGLLWILALAFLILTFQVKLGQVGGALENGEKYALNITDIERIAEREGARHVYIPNCQSAAGDLDYLRKSFEIEFGKAPEKSLSGEKVVLVVISLDLSLPVETPVSEEKKDELVEPFKEAGFAVNKTGEGSRLYEIYVASRNLSDS